MFCACFDLIVAACITTLGTRSVLDFWSQEEPSSAVHRAEWPRCGGCVVASARTHARSWRGKTGQPEWDLGPHSQAIKGPHEYYCALLSKSPQLFTKGWPTHTKNIAAKWWRRLQQLPLCSAQSSSTIIAQRRTSPVLCKLCDSSKRLLFLSYSGCSSSGKQRTRAQSSRRSHGTICIAPIIPENLFLHGYIVSLKTPLFRATKGQLNLIKGKAKYKMHLSSRKRGPS